MITLRLATPEDIPALWALKTHTIREICISHYTHDQIALWTSLPAPVRSYQTLIDNGSTLVAEEDRRLLGYAMLQREKAEVEGLFVAPDHTRRGIGRRLLRSLEEMAVAHSLARLQLFAALNAVTFYEAAGFKTIRREQFAHPSGVSLGCVYMEKSLLPASPRAVSSPGLEFRHLFDR